jgi:tetratricopeptide (TPR) repeat protein
MFSSLSFVKNLWANSLWLSILCCTTSLSCHSSVYQHGLDAVKQKKYTQAIDYFKQVIDEGGGGIASLPLVHFNLGVCYYRVERYDKANESFKRAMTSNALLWRSVFNLALVAERQQRWNHAGRLYEKVVADAGNPDLITLAKTKLAHLTSESLIAAPHLLNRSQYSLPLTWAGTVSAGFGQDSDVIDPKDLSGTGSDDSFYEIFAAAYRPFWVSGSRYFLFNTLAYTAKYDSVEEFDVNLVNVGLEHRWRLNKQLLSTGISAQYSTVGRDDYLLQQAFHGSSRWLFDSKAKLLAKYEYRDYKALDSIYDPLEGYSHEVKLSWYSPWIDNHRFKATMFVIDDERADNMFSSPQTSFSSMRQGTSAAWDYRDGPVQWTVDLEYRNSDYDGRNTLAFGVEKSREDKRYKASVNWQYSISAEWEINFEYVYTENKSNIDNYSYLGGVATYGVNYEF